MAAVPDLYKNVNISDGQVFVTADMNGFVRYQQAKITDQIIEKLIGGIVGTISADTPDVDFPGSMNGANSPTSLAYALNCGGACPAQGTTNAKLKITPGTLFQKIGNADGNDSTLLGFTFDGTEFVTIANGDVTHPRIDIVEMKLELVDTLDTASRDVEDAVTDAPSSQTVNTTHRVQMTLQVKAGTPATNPTFPAVDAGFVPIAAVYVGTNYVAAAGFHWDDTAGATAVVYDLRMPVGVKCYRVNILAMVYDTTKWILDSTRRTLTTAAAATALKIPCPVTTGRIVAVSITSKGMNTATAQLGQSQPDIVSISTMATLRNMPTTGGSILEQQNTFRYWDPAVAVGAAPASNYGAANLPVWANGRRGPTEVFKNGAGDGISGDSTYYDSFAAIAITNPPTPPSVAIVYSAKFWVAEGV